MVECPECEYESSKQGVKIHYGRSHEGTISGVIVECSECGKKVRKPEYKLERSENLFCSKSCRGDYASRNPFYDGNPKEYPEVECANCGKNIRKKPCHAKKFERNYCDRECMYEHVRKSKINSGENHYNWKGGHDPYYGPNWSFQREKRRKIDDYKCVVCKITEKESKKKYGFELDVHHVKPKRKFDDLEKANKIDNLITVCKKCHKKWESIGLRPDLKTKDSKKSL